MLVLSNSSVGNVELRLGEMEVAHYFKHRYQDKITTTIF